MNKHLIRFNYLILLALIVFPSKIYAVSVTTEFGPADNVISYANLILGRVMPWVEGLAVIMLIWAGYKYMTSQGNQEAITEAKDITVGVITGILLLFLIRVILSQVGVTNP